MSIPTKSIFVVVFLINSIAFAGSGTVQQVLRTHFPSVRLDSTAKFAPAQEFVAGHAISGFRAEGALRVLYPASYDDVFVVEMGEQRLAVRSVGSRFAPASESAGTLVYATPHDSIDVVEVPSAGRSEELLVLHDSRAPHVFEYDIVEMRGLGAPFLQDGAIRFTPERVAPPTPPDRANGRFTTPLPSLQIDRPWVIDATGARSDTAAQWTIVAEDNGRAVRIRLTLSADSLTYPLVIDPSFSTTGSLGTARANHTTTLLPNGKVLIAGGVGSNTAELYDPATGNCTPTGVMNAPRYLHTATLLLNGKVLLAGGVGAAVFSPSLDSAEIYDPATGIFTPAGTMTAPRQNATATLLSNGKVLIAAGNNGISSVNTAELYDPLAGPTGSFTATANLSGARAAQTATLLPNGKVLIAGGVASFNSLSSAEIFDPAGGTNGTFTATGNMTAGRSGHSATLLATGRVLIAGAATAELFDPAAGTFSLTGGRTFSSAYHTATLLPNGKVLLAGGKGATVQSAAELYDPASGTFTATSPMVAARYEHDATLLPDGHVLIAGGYNDVAYLNSVERYELSNPTFTAAPSMDVGRRYHTMTLLTSGNVLITGGESGGLTTTFVEKSALLFDVSVGGFISTPPMTTPREGHAATLLSDGRVLITGGGTTAELYDPSIGPQGHFTAAQPMASARANHTATLLRDGTVLIAGYTNNGELYHPADGTFTSIAAPMATHREHHTATLLNNGKVLITGGMNGSTFLNSAEIYDPAVQTFTATSNMTTARSAHTATLLPNGKVLIAGGVNSVTTIGTAELFDPNSGIFTSTSSAMITPRSLHAAVLQPSGRVLLLGGAASSGATLSAAELFDPATGTFTATTSMTALRAYPMATLLTTGKTLITGGWNFGDLSSTELYDPGLGYAEGRRPVISTQTNPLCQPASLALSGLSFTGDSEASGGSTNNSATNAPLLRLQRIDSQQLQFVQSLLFSASSFSSAILSNLASGPYQAVILTNAIPSHATIIDIDTTPLLGTYPNTTMTVSAPTVVAPSSLPAGYNGAFYNVNVSHSAGLTAGLGVNDVTGAVSITNASPAGDYTITISSSTLCGSASASFGLTVDGPPFALVATAGTPQSTSTNAAFTTPLQVTVTDSAGHALNNVSVTFSGPASGASATFSGGGAAMTNASGVATITATANATFGSYAVTAVVGGLTGTFALTNVAPGTPTSIVATAMNLTTVVTVDTTWSGTAGATYEVMRVAAGGVSTTIGSSTSGTLTDTTAIGGQAYLYYVRQTAPAVTGYGTPDLATTVILRDPTLVSGTAIKAVHITDLRAAVDAVRALAGKGPGSYTDTTISTGSMVTAADLLELRSALNEARTALVLSPAVYTSAIATGNVISVADVNDLRTGVR